MPTRGPFDAGSHAGFDAGFDAVVLAGGGARRLGGGDKTALVLGARPLLDHVLGGVGGAHRLVVVGPRRPTVRRVRWAREDPPGGGPAAALGAGLAAMRVLPGDRAPYLALLAGDAPFAGEAIPRLVATVASAGPDVDGAMLLDAGGRDQLLISVWRWAAIDSAVEQAGELAGAPLHRLLGDLRSARVTARGHEALDCDTAADLATARRLVVS